MHFLIIALALGGGLLLLKRVHAGSLVLIPGFTYRVTFTIPGDPSVETAADDANQWIAKGWLDANEGTLIHNPAIGVVPASTTMVSRWGRPQTVVTSNSDANVFPSGAVLINLEG